jgi:sulfur transfer protein SufE
MASKYFERMGLRVELTEKRDYGLIFAYKRLAAFLFLHH